MTHEERAGVNGEGESVDSGPLSSNPAPEDPRRKLGAGPADPGRPAPEEESNSIRPARRRRGPTRPMPSKDAEYGAPVTRPTEDSFTRPTDAGKAESDPWTVPQQVRDRFIQEGHRFYFKDGSLAFRDHGRRLSTPSENTEVIASLIEIARSRGWQEIKLEGTERFRREAWRQGGLAGLTVRGYQPSAAEYTALLEKEAEEGRGERDASASAPAQTTAPPERPERNAQARSRADELIVGKLLEHGREPYRFNPGEAMSYFVRIETREGRRTFWGKDLERALGESLTQAKIGDEIGLRRIGSERVTVKRRERDAEGALLREEEVPAHRHRWVIEKRDFFEARARAAETFRDPRIAPSDGARRHPELMHAYLRLHVAELAVRVRPDPEERRRLLEQVRSALADRIARGERVKPVHVRERPAHPQEREREEDLARH